MRPTEIHTLREESHMWPAAANCRLLTDADGAILIDVGCGTPSRYEKLKTFLKAHGFKPADVHTVVLSHAHPDHMGTMPFLLEEAAPRIFIHPLEKPLAKDPQLLNNSFDMGHIIKYYSGRLENAKPEDFNIIDYFANLCPMGSAETTDTLEEGDVIPLAGRKFEVLHTPGHAPGHVSLYDREHKLLLVGDVIGAVVAWYCPSGGGAKGYLGSLKKVESLDVQMAMPSHGEDITDVQAAVDRTRDTIMSRDRRILDALSGGPLSLLELTDILFPQEGTRMFPGLQITDSHLVKLEEERRVLRSEQDTIPLFLLPNGVRS